MKKYLISGIGPGTGGVGRLMKKLMPTYEAEGYEVIYKPGNESLRKLISDKNLVRLAKEVFKRMLGQVRLDFKCMRVKNSEIVFIHPQNAGFKNLFRLVKNQNQIYLYVMDSSFFCIRSYNTHPVRKEECLNCLGYLKPDNVCRPFPIPYKKQSNIDYLEKLKRISGEIKFLAQNNNQAALLREHFGQQSNIEVIGMDTGELLTSDQRYTTNHVNTDIHFDIVFHGAPLIEKGVGFVIEIAEHLPHYSFLIPSAKKVLQKVMGHSSLPDNVHCVDMTWETGLREAVICARLVINPSLWSAPIEGALLKSAFYNINVATVNSMYGFEAEFKGIKNHLRLSRNVKIASTQIMTFINKN